MTYASLTFDRGQDNDTIRNLPANEWEITLEKRPKRVAVSHLKADFKPISGDWRGTTPCNHFNYAITDGAVKGHARAEASVEGTRPED